MRALLLLTAVAALILVALLVLAKHLVRVFDGDEAVRAGEARAKQVAALLLRAVVIVAPGKTQVSGECQGKG